MKIQFVNPCMNADYEVNSRNGVMHPLGLLSVATFLRQEVPQVEIELLDGSIQSREEINARVGGDIVACTTGILSYEHALQVAQLAKDQGSRVVFGGPLAEELPREILANRCEVDWVVTGEGEHAFAAIVKGSAPDEVANLAWRSGSEICVNDRKQLDLDELPFPDRGFLDVEKYFENYRGININAACARPMTFYTGKGCLYATRHGRCVFCARMDKGYRMRNPERVWREMQELSSSYGADAFWDVADSILSDEEWMLRFAAARPREFQPKLFIYGRADAISETTCKLLAQLGVYQIFIGFESGSDAILRQVGFGKTVEQGTQAARMLADHGIRILGSFVIGLPGETIETVKETIDYAHVLRDLGNLETISASVMMPLPGSQVFRALQDDYPTKYRGVDFFDLEGAREDWLSRHTSVSLDHLYGMLPDLLSAGQIASSLGRPRGVV